jgi:DNA-binding transcriptional MerR regulator
MLSESNISSYQEVEQIAQSLGISKSMIRFWEEEFGLAERSNGIMSPREVAEIRLIHHLISENDLTLEDAKIAFLEKHPKVIEKFDMIERLENIKKGLLTLRENI